MKRGKRLTYEQKCIVSANNLNPKEWMFVEEWETKIVVRHKVTGKDKAVNKRKG